MNAMPVPRLLIALTAALMAGACAIDGAQPPETAKPVTTCQAERVQYLVGRMITDRTAAAAKRGAHTEQLRIILPDTAVTMDFRPDRLNIDVRQDKVILRIHCG
jgi:hypothetical protein